jgi:hypothetical protein
MIDILLLAIIAAVTWCVASEGAWGAALICISVLFSGLLAMNYFEPLANHLQQMAPAWGDRCDVIALVGLFTGFVLLFRAATDHLSPTFIQLDGIVYEIGRWSSAALTGYVTMAFLLTALHTAPLPREFIGFRPERNNLLELAAPDRQWLGFVHYVSEKNLQQRSRRRFDGPSFQVGTATNTVWPSFPIRYATRRDSTASIASQPPTLQPLQPVQPTAPGSGGRGEAPQPGF